MPPKVKQEKMTQRASQAKKKNEDIKVSSIVEKEAAKVVVKSESANSQLVLDPDTVARRAANAGGMEVSETQVPSRASLEKSNPVAKWQRKMKKSGPGTMDITQFLNKVDPQDMSVHRNKIQDLEKQRQKELLKDNKKKPPPRDVDRKKDKRIVKNTLKVNKKAQQPAKNSFIGPGFEAFPIGSVAKRGPIAPSRPSLTQAATQGVIESYDQYATQVATDPEASQAKKSRKS